MIEPGADRPRCVALSRLAGLSALAGGQVVCIDTFRHAAPEMRKFESLCPFTTWDGLPFPVPGLPGRRAGSVEGIWQGLKLVDGTTDLSQLTSAPHMRPPDHLRAGSYDYRSSIFRYGDRQVDLVTARLVIYLPIYILLLDQIVPTAIHDELHAALESGRTLAFYDWDSNMDIDNDRSSFSHSAVLAAWFGGRLEPLIKRWRDCEAELTGEEPPVMLRRYRSQTSRS